MEFLKNSTGNPTVHHGALPLTEENPHPQLWQVPAEAVKSSRALAQPVLMLDQGTDLTPAGPVATQSNRIPPALQDLEEVTQVGLFLSVAHRYNPS